MNWCDLLWGIVAAANTAAAWAVSWMLDNSEWWSGWWTPLSDGVKRLLYAVFTLAVGALAYVGGYYGLKCGDWPTWDVVLPILITAALSWFAGAYRHERAKRY